MKSDSIFSPSKLLNLAEKKSGGTSGRVERLDRVLSRKKLVKLEQYGVMQGKHAEVIVVATKASISRSSSGENNADHSTEVFALKRQQSSYPTAHICGSLTNKSFRELLIFLQLAKHIPPSVCPNFVRLIDWFYDSDNNIESEHDTSAEERPESAPPDSNKENRVPSKQPARRVVSENANSGTRRTLRSYRVATTKPESTKSADAITVTLNLVLEYVGAGTLQQHKHLKLHEYRSVLFQLLFALHIAQQECQFMHTDLHLRNILVSRPKTAADQRTTNTKSDDQDEVCESELDDASQPAESSQAPKPDKPDKFAHVYVDLSSLHQDKNAPEDKTLLFWGIPEDSLIIKITDFGLSRIRLDNDTVVFNLKNKFTEMFLPQSDLEQLVNALKGLDLCQGDIPDDEFREASTKLNDLKKKMRDISATPRQLLRHEFFEELIIDHNNAQLHFSTHSINHPLLSQPLQ